MSAQIIEFAAAAAARRIRVLPPRRTADLSHDFTFWRGASGTRYVHTVFGLVDCPELPNANVVLVKRLPNGQAEPLQAVAVEHDVPSLNLAAIRQAAAAHGANEVHVHLLASSAAKRGTIERDLNGAGALDAAELVSGGLAG